MQLSTTATGLALGVLACALGAAPAGAAGPVAETGSVSGEAFITDCGDFDIIDRFETIWSARVFLDEEGNPERVVEHVWGSDTFVNSVTGESVSGTISSGEKVDLVAGTVNQNGTIGRITLPGVGLVFIDVGRYVFDLETGEFVFLKGQHGFINEEYDGLCAVLAP